MQINKGAPLRALSAIAMIWISVRIVWEAAFPTSHLGAVEAAETGNIFVEGRPLEVSHPLSSSMRPNAAGSNRKDGQQISYAKASSVLSASAFALLQSPATTKETAKEVPPASPHQAPHSLPGVMASSSSTPLSGYFWIFARQSRRSGEAVPVLQSPGGQYGGSQAGAILTYRLAGNPQHHLSAFVRASSAISVSGQEEVAIGLSARLFPKIPVSLLAEKRMGAGRLHNRGTAVYVAGGTGPDMLPETWVKDVSLETYGQAGFLFADDDSYFFDVSASVQRKLWERDNYKLTVGAGAWAGGQEGVTRFDIGPRANVDIPVGRSNLRLSVDWRQRIGGNAVPDSGVAVTVSTGF